MNIDALLRAEMAVLSICCQNPAMISLATSVIAEIDFVDEENRKAWNAISSSGRCGPVEMVKAGVSTDTVQSLFTEWHGAPDNLNTYADTILDASRSRRIKQVCAEIAQQDISADQAVELMMGAADAVMRRSSEGAVKFIDAAEKAMVAVSEARRLRDERGEYGMTFGLPALDYALGGLHGPRLLILAALSGCGKTAMLNKFAIHNARRGRAGVIFSLEMGADELMIRTMASESNVNISRLSRGTASDDEINSSTDAMCRLGDIPLWLNTETYSLEKIVAQATLMKAQHDLKWIGVDHIGLVGGQKSGQSRNDWLGEVSWTLKRLAKRLNIPVVGLCQFSRGPAKEDRRPQLHDLRDSGNIEQDADVVMMLYCKNEQRTKTVREIEVGLPKNRIGPAVWLDEQFTFDGRYQTFHEMAA